MNTLHGKHALNHREKNTSIHREKLSQTHQTNSVNWGKINAINDGIKTPTIKMKSVAIQGMSSLSITV
jgi:hypothetical protein